MNLLKKIFPDKEPEQSEEERRPKGMATIVDLQADELDIDHVDPSE